MRMRPDADAGMGGTRRIGEVGKTLWLAAAFFVWADSAPPAQAAASAQVPFEQAVRDLTAADADTRARAAQMLKETPYPEAAVPLAKAVVDSANAVQLEAIAAELNIFLAERVVVRKRVGLVVEVRNPIAAEAAFSAGPLAAGPAPVPVEVLTALRQTARDDNPRVGLEALYAFGVLAVAPVGAARRELLEAAAPDLVALGAAGDPELRYAALRVIARLFEKRPQDKPIDESVGDALIAVLNDTDAAIRIAAMEALGAMRYERAIQALTDLFDYYGRGDVGVAALDALAHIAHPASVPRFAQQLANRNAVLRTIAIEGLARSGDRSQAAALQGALAGERNEGVRLAGVFASAMLANGPLDPLAMALARGKVRDQARQYLVEAAPGRTESLAAYARESEPRIRADVADVFALAGDPAALPVLESMLNDGDAQVARAAERAVARLRAVNADPPQRTPRTQR